MKLSEILEIVSKISKVPLISLKRNNRTEDVFFARWCYFYIASKETCESLESIALLVNNTHCIASYAINKINTVSYFRNKYYAFLKKYKNYIIDNELQIIADWAKIFKEYENN